MVGQKRLFDSEKMRRGLLLAVAFPLMPMLSACALPTAAPTPAFDSVVVKSETFSHAAYTGLDVVPDWWTKFDDPVLATLVEQALTENRDIASAQANLQVAESLLRSAKLGASYSTSTRAGADLGRSSGPNRDVQLSVSGNLGASWEYDAFGMIDAQIKAAVFNREAARESKRDIAVLVAAQTAQAYVDLRGAQQRLAVARQNAELQAEGLGLLTALVENGRSTELDLNRSDALYRTTLASLQTFKAAEETAGSRLAALTGTIALNIGDTASVLSLSGPIPEHPTDLATGNPQDLIARRPDIRRAEAEVARLLALSDIERSRLFPRIVFNADFGGLFNGTNRIDQLSSLGFGIGPAISWEGPDLRAVRVDIDTSDARTKAAIARYEQTVFDALSEVESALSLYKHEIDRRDDLRRASQSARNALDLARLRFDEGLDDFLDVLDAQRTLLDVEGRRVQNDILITTYAISVYRALGGMWTDAELTNNAKI